MVKLQELRPTGKSVVIIQTKKLQKFKNTIRKPTGHRWEIETRV